MRRDTVYAAALVLALAAAGCRSGQSAPARALDRYGAALESHDYGEAYELMSESFRAKHSQEDFIRMMKDSAREVEETAARLRGAHGKVEITAELRYGLGDSMRLVREEGEWRIASNPIQFYSQKTPREALRSFVRAYRLERWDVMLRLVPNKYRERMTVEMVENQFQGPRADEVATMLNLIEANLDAPITDKGNEARMSFGDRYEVELVREDGQWKLRDLY